MAVACAGVAMVVASRLFGTEALMPIGLAFAAAPIAGFLLVRRAVGARVVAIEVSPERPVAGEDVTVHARAERPTGWLRGLVRQDVDVPMDDLLGARGPTRIRRGAWRLEAVPRGLHRIGPARLVVADPLGLVVRSRSSGGQALVRVAPATIPLAAVLPAPGRARGVGLERGTQIGGRYEIAGVRDYRPGDAPSRIHWPQSARRKSLQTVDLAGAEAASRRAWVLLDADARATEAERADFERAVSVAASIGVALARDGSLAGLAHSAAPDERVPDGRDLPERILDALTLVTPTGRGAAALVTRHAGRRVLAPLLVIVTPAPSPTLVSAVDAAVAAGTRVMALIVAESVDLAPLAGTGAAVARVPRLDALPRALEELRENRDVA